MALAGDALAAAAGLEAAAARLHAAAGLPAHAAPGGPQAQEAPGGPQAQAAPGAPAAADALVGVAVAVAPVVRRARVPPPDNYNVILAFRTRTAQRGNGVYRLDLVNLPAARFMLTREEGFDTLMAQVRARVRVGYSWDDNVIHLAARADTPVIRHVNVVRETYLTYIDRNFHLNRGDPADYLVHLSINVERIAQPRPLAGQLVGAAGGPVRRANRGNMAAARAAYEPYIAAHPELRAAGPIGQHHQVMHLARQPVGPDGNVVVEGRLPNNEMMRQLNRVEPLILEGELARVAREAAELAEFRPVIMRHWMGGPDRIEFINVGSFREALGIPNLLRVRADNMARGAQEREGDGPLPGGDMPDDDHAVHEDNAE